MIILTEDGKKLVDVVSVYVANIPDKEDRNKVFEYKVKRHVCLMVSKYL